MDENIDKQDHLMATGDRDIEIDKDRGDEAEEEREEEEKAEKEVDEEEEGEEKEDGGYCYQKLQQHKDEALANKKRKSLEQCLTSECNEGISFKKAGEDDISEEKCAEVMEAMSIGGGRRSRKRKQPKKRGRRKGSKKKLDDRLSRMLGDANLHYSNGCYDKAIAVLHELVRLEPSLPDSYHILGLVHKELGDYQKEMEFYMFAAPKYPLLWQTLSAWSMVQMHHT